MNVADHGDERNGWGARVRKCWSNDLHDTIPPTSLPLVTHLIGGLVLAYVDSILSSVVVRDGGTDNLRETADNRGLHKPGVGMVQPLDGQDHE